MFTKPTVYSQNTFYRCFEIISLINCSSRMNTIHLCNIRVSLNTVENNPFLLGLLHQCTSENNIILCVGNNIEETMAVDLCFLIWEWMDHICGFFHSFFLFFFSHLITNCFKGCGQFFYSTPEPRTVAGIYIGRIDIY